MTKKIEAFELYCDGQNCGAALASKYNGVQFTRTEDDARLFAEADEWTYVGSNDYCPECSGKREGSKL